MISLFCLSGAGDTWFKVVEKTVHTLHMHMDKAPEDEPQMLTRGQIEALRRRKTLQAQDEIKKLQVEAKAGDKEDLVDQATLAASKKKMKEWMRGHRLQDYVADVTRIAGECVASLPSLRAHEPLPDLACWLAGTSCQAICST